MPHDYIDRKSQSQHLFKAYFMLRKTALKLSEKPSV